MSQQQALAERYGAPSPTRRRATLAAVGVLWLAFAGWLAWTVLVHGDPDVDSELVTWTVQDDHAVTARLAVRLGSGDVTASCVVRAFADDRTVVGEVSFDVTPADLAVSGAGSDDLSGEVTVDIRTERRATGVDPVGCTTPDQVRPR